MNAKNTKNVRLQSFLAHAGVASRRAAVDIIKEGRVKIDGKIVKERGCRVDPDSQRITVDGKIVNIEKKKACFIFNKPAGVVTTLKDSHAERKIADYFNDIDLRLYPVGRLDKDTTGIILMTNDGDLAYRLSHPKFNIKKEYLVWVSGGLNPEGLKKIRDGVELDEAKTSRCRVEVLAKEADMLKLKVILHEGRKRQIRRMFKAVGCRVEKLKRSRYAGLWLGRLGLGKKKKLNDSEVKRLKKMVGLNQP